MADDDLMMRLVGILACAPTEPARWGEFLREICARIVAHQAAIISHDFSRKEHTVLAGVGEAFDGEGNDLYKSYYWRFDEWTSAFFQMGKPGGLFLGKELWPEEEFRKSVFYNEFLSTRNICQMAGIYCETGNQASVGISLYRGAIERGFGHEQLSILEVIAPHLEVSFRTRRRLAELEGRVSELEAALDSLRSALLLVNRAGNVIFLNQRARVILGRKGGLSIHHGIIVGVTARDTANLRALIEKATLTSAGKGAYGGGAMALSRAGKRPLQILVAPVSPANQRLPGNAAAAIFLDDPEIQPVVPAEVLRTLYGLTPAEARLALSVLGGHTVSEAAELGRVSRETVKSQMSAVLAKTGTRRQGELIRLLSGLAGVA